MNLRKKVVLYLASPTKVFQLSFLVDRSLTIVILLRSTPALPCGATPTGWFSWSEVFFLKVEGAKG